VGDEDLAQALVSVVVQFRVRVPDVDRFKAAIEKWRPKFEADGARNAELYTAENDPNEIGWFAEWDSHDQMMEASEKHGEEFQADAGTEGLDWETRIWHKLA
jgi:quinol monooxygenase YgiN